MDPEKTSYYRTLWMVALLIILIVLFLARDADYITGFTLDVNGGLYMP